MLQELTAVLIAVVYVPPTANVKEAMSILYNAISEQQTAYPDVFFFFIIAGDFSHASL